MGYKLDYSSSISMFNLIYCKEFVGHKIKIGYFNRIQIENLFCGENVKIRNLNRFTFIKKVNLKDNSAICSSNSFIGTRDFFSPYQEVFQVELGERSIITNSHYLDCSSKIIIGDNVVFGGIRSEVWTHGFDLNRIMILGDINIGNNVYIGSGSKILQGVNICDDVSIGAGTIVSKSIHESGFYISSLLIRKSDIADYSKHTNLINYEGAGFVKK
jgi:acetyltransferase-like isoleucine patch superfamily enzyme